MPDPSSSSNFFVVGGTLKRDAASYVKRPVDDEILQLTLAGNYCNVLAARQTGKSSLMVRTSERLKEQGVRTVIIDLTSIGSNVSPSEWYFGLLSRLRRELNLERRRERLVAGALRAEPGATFLRFPARSHPGRDHRPYRGLRR